MNYLPDPYTNVPDDKMWKLSGRISKADHDLIRAVFPDRGIYNLIVSNTIANLCHELRTNGIVHYTGDNTSLALNCLIRVVKPYARNAPLQESVRDDVGRAEHVRGEVETLETVPTDAPLPPVRRGRGDGKKKQGASKRETKSRDT